VLSFQRGAAVDKHKLKEIEEKDAQIARLIYEQEKLKKAKRDKGKELRQEASGSAVSSDVTSLTSYRTLRATC